MRWTSILVILCLLLPGCTKSRNTSGPGGKPGVGAPGVGAPPGSGAAPTATPPAPPPGAPSGAPPPPGAPGEGAPAPKRPTVPANDGPTLGTLFPTLKSFAASAGKKEMKVDDAEVVKALFKALNPDQKVKGNRKGCQFSYAFVIKDGSGKDMGTVGLCGPLGPNSLAVLADSRVNTEWQITVPDGKALAALLDKHLPGAKWK